MHGSHTRVLLLLPSIAVVSACMAADRPVADSSESITILYDGGDEAVFGPEWDDSPKFLIFQPLASQSVDWCAEPDGGLAEHIEHSADWRTWTVRLRPDVRWHDGEPVTAEDIAFTLRLWRHPDVECGGAQVDSVEMLDPHTLRLVLKRPGTWPLAGWDVFYPAHVLQDLDPKDFFSWDFWKQPVGSGPYRYVRHLPETMTELEANPDFVGGEPRIRRVVLQYRAGAGRSGIMELRAGTADLVTGVSPLDAAKIAEDPRYHLYHVWQGTAEWLIWNHNDPRLGDVRVRRALTHALDRREYARMLGFPDALPITDAPAVFCRETDPPAWPALAADTAEAGRLLAEAGWEDRDGDGIREWVGPPADGLTPGDPLRIALVVSQRNERSAVLIADQLADVGVAIDIHVLAQELVHGRFSQGDFQAIIPPSVHGLYAALGLDSPIGPADTLLARLVAEARAEPDAAIREERFRSLSERYLEVLPATLLAMRTSTMIAHRRIRGLGEPGSIIPRASWRWPYGGLEDLWIEETP